MTVPTFDTTSQLTLLRPGDTAYDRERTSWNLAVDHRPALIALPTNEAEVSAAIRLAADRDAPIAVRATGHGPAAAATDDAILINTRRLDRVDIDAPSATAIIGAGVKWDQVIAAAAPYGLAPLVGSTPDVSAVGYLTGGGLPVLSRQYGFSADQITSFRIVTPDGEVRSVSPGSEPDLFWAVRGAKDNFGIVTSVTIDLLPIAGFYGGGLYFGWDQARTVATTWLEWTRHIGEDMSTSLALLAMPGMDGGPGELMISVRIAYTGDPLVGARFVAPVRDLGPVQDTVDVRPYIEIGEVHADPIDPVPIHEWATLLHGLDRDTLADVLDRFGAHAGTSPGLVEIRHLGGAVAREPAISSAIGHRTAAFTFLSGLVSMPGMDNAIESVQEDLAQAIARWDTHAVFPNFLSSGHTDPERVRRAYVPEDYARLADLKQSWDPANRFRLNHNIPPARP